VSGREVGGGVASIGGAEAAIGERTQRRKKTSIQIMERGWHFVVKFSTSFFLLFVPPGLTALLQFTSGLALTVFLTFTIEWTSYFVFFWFEVIVLSLFELQCRCPPPPTNNYPHRTQCQVRAPTCVRIVVRRGFKKPSEPKAPLRIHLSIRLTRLQ
jgi:hypothetical protein